MSTRIEPINELPTYDEMQAAMRAGRRLRSEAFAEFFGFGVSAKSKAGRKADDRAVGQAGMRGAAAAGC